MSLGEDAMLRKTPLATAISSASLASALVATSVAMPAFGANEAIIDEVVVTGTRIKRHTAYHHRYHLEGDHHRCRHKQYR